MSFVRRFGALPLLLTVCLLVADADAARVYRVAPGAAWPASSIPYVQRELPGLRLAILPDDAPEWTDPSVLEVDAAAGEDLYLVELHPGQDLGALGSGARVAWSGEDWALVATPDPRRDLDTSGLCRERLTWLPPAPRPSVRRPFAAKAVDPQVKQSIIDAVSQSRFSQIVRELSGNIVFWLNGSLSSTNNRYTHTAGSGSGIDIAAAYLQDRFEAVGYPVTRQSFFVGATQTDNIIAIKQGTVFPDEIIVVGAHYDSISESPMSSAPGAEDNGSGTAAVLHLAEVFANYDTERTIHFVCFSGEEEGLHGSQYYVSQLAANGWTVTNALTMDMITTWQSNYKVIIEGQTAWESLMSLFESNVATYAQIGSRKDYFSFGSDHVPFQQAGIPAFLAIDWDYDIYPGYHTTNDVWANLDPTLGWRIMKAMAGALADLAVPLPQPTATPPRRPALALEQNTPNPFNPTTLIRFTLPEDGHARLRIYDLAGRFVQTVVDADLPAGDHIGQWDGTDLAGRHVASGTYLYRLENGKEVRTRRMVLAK